MPAYAEKSLKWLIKTFNNLKRLKFDILLVPVCLNYDRIFEASFLAKEMISD